MTVRKVASNTRNHFYVFPIVYEKKNLKKVQTEVTRFALERKDKSRRLPSASGRPRAELFSLS